MLMLNLTKQQIDDLKLQVEGQNAIMQQLQKERQELMETVQEQKLHIKALKDQMAIMENRNTTVEADLKQVWMYICCCYMHRQSQVKDYIEESDKKKSEQLADIQIYRKKVEKLEKSMEEVKGENPTLYVQSG